MGMNEIDERRVECFDGLILFSLWAFKAQGSYWRSEIFPDCM